MEISTTSITATIISPGNDVVQVSVKPGETLEELLNRCRVNIAPDTEVRVNGVLVVADSDDFNQPVPVDAQIVITSKIAGAVI